MLVTSLVLTSIDKDDEPDVIPLNFTGSADTDMTTLSLKDLMAWGTMNTWNDGEEGVYAIRHGQRPVRDFGQIRGSREEASRDAMNGSNFFERAYPCLYPWGRGGVESIRETPVSFTEHVKWSLQYFDRRFRLHGTFPFLAFGISQRRQVLLAARLQMKRSDFERNVRLMSSITMADLQAAQLEEESNKPISNPAVQVMRKHILAMSSRVQGSDASRLHLRSQIWSTNIRLGPPSIWITINPSDIHDPIAQVFAGEKIDLDNFVSTMGPNKQKRQHNIAKDPYAAAKFFRFIIKVIHETLFQIKVSKFQTSSEMGTLGRVKAYFATSENQGRGTLHLHELLWLDDTPSPSRLEEMLKSDEFRDRIASYIKATFRAHLPGLESNESIQSIPRNPEVAYNRPPNPDSLSYDDDIRNFELRLARSEQIHSCRPHQCMILDKNGVYRCKRRAPFPCSNEDWIDEKGNWRQKRLNGYVNGWIPSVLINGRCNNNGKLLTNGRDTKNITFYVSSYAAKKQGRSYNLSSIMATTYAYHLRYPNDAYIDNIRFEQNALLRRITNAINREQEIAAPMVMSYLMGWGDTFCTHHYSPVYWSSFNAAILQAHPDLLVRESDE